MSGQGEAGKGSSGGDAGKVEGRPPDSRQGKDPDKGNGKMEIKIPPLGLRKLERECQGPSFSQGNKGRPAPTSPQLYILDIVCPALRMYEIVTRLLIIQDRG